MRRARFFHGIRFRLLVVALALVAVPWLAAKFIARMETFLRQSQEQSIAATARAVAAALSDRPQLFSKAAEENDRQGEERRRIIALFAAADTDAAAGLGTAYDPSDEIERLLSIMGRRGERLWVIDNRSRVRGLSGSLKDETLRRTRTSWLRGIISSFVPTPQVQRGDESRPVRGQIDRALGGVVSTQWRGTRDPEVAIVSAAQPLFVGDDIVGAVVVEETTGAIQLLKQSALENLLAATIAVVGGSLVILLFFASRLATRIRRLHAQAESAIDSQGRVRGNVEPSSARDEIGDLSRTMAAVMARLRDYNAYLESMAGRLSHELRTPVAVVRSSLDNLKQQPLDREARVYVERAGEGVERLARLISRLSEATRLERMLESAERERFDLSAVVAGCVDGYRAAYPARRFELARPEAPVIVEGVPDSFAQLLDKLIENASDFAPPETAIRITVASRAPVAQLAVENSGPPLAEETLGRLFDSMVTLRAADQARVDGAHLGLGLYIVRLIAEFHGGRVRASNLADGAGVRFEVEIPLPRSSQRGPLALP
ncbi:MAG TPA: ATP-binding protein [Usitatibacter sp.]|nr:ATP-binding protein [Usitatibacter sp.]